MQKNRANITAPALFLNAVFGVFFTVFIFAEFSSLADSARYLGGEYDPEKLYSRTHALIWVGYFLNKIFMFDILVNFFLSFCVAFSIYKLFKGIYFTQLERLAIYVVLYSPTFLVYSSIIGKELVVIVAAVGYFHALFVQKNSMFAVFFLLVIVFFRPHLSLAYAFFGLLFYRLSRSKIFFIEMLGVFLAFIVLCFIFYSDVLSVIETVIMPVSQRHFSLSSNTTRVIEEWNTVYDFIFNMYWGIPVQLLGPTFFESFNRPMFFVYFFYGILLWVVSVCFTIRILFEKNILKRYRAFFVAVVVLIIALILNYPLSLFNSGSSLRYVVNIYPIIFFMPLLFLKLHKSESN